MRTPCASMAIMRHLEQRSLELLMQERADGKGLDIPGGLVEEGEAPEEAAVRETQEESGLIVDANSLRQLGETFQKTSGDENEHLVAIHLFMGRVVGGYLRTSKETTGFYWVSLSALPEIRERLSLNTPRGGYPLGIMYAMVERALTGKYQVLSTVHDPDGLAKIL